MFKPLYIMLGIFIGSLAFDTYAEGLIGTIKVTNHCPRSGVLIFRESSPGCRVIGGNESWAEGKDFEAKVVANKGCYYIVVPLPRNAYKDIRTLSAKVQINENKLNGEAFCSMQHTICTCG